MQMTLDFGATEDMEWVRDQLRFFFGRPGAILMLTPIGQLVKSSISGRTRDEVSLGAYRRLANFYREWPDMGCATAAEIESIIGDVTFPDIKARRLCGALCAIAVFRPDFDLAFLGSRSVVSALEWLEQLPGVGRKVSASTLNFSTLQMPAFVVDTHILRILRRFGFVRSNADTREAYDRTMAMLHGWSAADLVELHILMKRLGQNICRADHAFCQRCPISRRCHASAGQGRSSAAGGSG